MTDLTTSAPDRVRELVLDVRDADAVADVVDRAAGCFGGLDVVVNNAGTGLVGAVEEVDERTARDHLDVNLFGALWVSRAVVPHLRAGGGGDIVQVSTVGAIGSMPLLGLYNAGKWALEGFSEALAAEVAGFGIRVTLAELGGFATDWAGSSMGFAQPHERYDDLRRSLFGTAEVPWPAGDGNGGGPPPARAADALLAHLERPDRPLRVVIGDDAGPQAAAALTARRDSYGRDPGFAWPA